MNNPTLLRHFTVTVFIYLRMQFKIIKHLHGQLKYAFPGIDPSKGFLDACPPNHILFDWNASVRIAELILGERLKSVEGPLSAPLIEEICRRYRICKASEFVMWHVGQFPELPTTFPGGIDPQSTQATQNSARLYFEILRGHFHWLAEAVYGHDTMGILKSSTDTGVGEHPISTNTDQLIERIMEDPRFTTNAMKLVLEIAHTFTAQGFLHPTIITDRALSLQFACAVVKMGESALAHMMPDFFKAPQEAAAT